MKRPFPTKQTDTLTRESIRRFVLKMNHDKTALEVTPQIVCVHFLGSESLVTARHLGRAWKLLRHIEQPKPVAEAKP